MVLSRDDYNLIAFSGTLQAITLRDFSEGSWLHSPRTWARGRYEVEGMVVLAFHFKVS
jgi:hypothetical protein